MFSNKNSGRHQASDKKQKSLGEDDTTILQISKHHETILKRHQSKSNLTTQHQRIGDLPNITHAQFAGLSILETTIHSTMVIRTAHISRISRHERIAARKSVTLSGDACLHVSRSEMHLLRCEACGFVV